MHCKAGGGEHGAHAAQLSSEGAAVLLQRVLSALSSGWRGSSNSWGLESHSEERAQRTWQLKAFGFGSSSVAASSPVHLRRCKPLQASPCKRGKREPPRSSQDDGRRRGGAQ